MFFFIRPWGYFDQFRAQIPDSRHFQPVLGKFFCVESEFEIKQTWILASSGQKLGKTNLRKLIFYLFLYFFIFFFIFLFFSAPGQLCSLPISFSGVAELEPRCVCYIPSLPSVSLQGPYGNFWKVLKQYHFKHHLFFSNFIEKS